jgi:hypothetical protein
VEKGLAVLTSMSKHSFTIYQIVELRLLCHSFHHKVRSIHAYRRHILSVSRLVTFTFVVETGKGASIMSPWKVAGVGKSNLEGIRCMLNRAERSALVVHILDAASGKPLEAQIWFPTIETEDVRSRTTHPTTGKYYRLLMPGSYKFVCTMPVAWQRKSVYPDCLSKGMIGFSLPCTIQSRRWLWHRHHDEWIEWQRLVASIDWRHR